MFCECEAKRHHSRSDDTRKKVFNSSSSTWPIWPEFSYAISRWLLKLITNVDNCSYFKATNKVVTCRSRKLSSNGQSCYSAPSQILRIGTHCILFVTFRLCVPWFQKIQCVRTYSTILMNTLDIIGHLFMLIAVSTFLVH